MIDGPKGCCISVHHSPFYEGPRVQVSRIGDLNITLEGDAIDFAVAPYMLANRTMCQVRPLAEAMGADVSWNAYTETVTFTLGRRTASCQIGSETARVNGDTHLLDEPPVMADGHTMVPLRFVAEALGFAVSWDRESRTANLRSL